MSRFCTVTIHVAGGCDNNVEDESDTTALWLTWCILTWWCARQVTYSPLKKVNKFERGVHAGIDGLSGPTMTFFHEVYTSNGN